MRKFNLSLKYKVMINQMGVPALLLLTYLLLFKSLFASNKIAHLYDTNSRVDRNIGAQESAFFCVRNGKAS